MIGKWLRCECRLVGGRSTLTLVAIKKLALIAVIVVGLIPTLACASYWLVIHSRSYSREYDLPPPHRSARIIASEGRLQVWVDGTELRVDNGWLTSVPGIDLNTAVLARGSDDPDLFVLIRCGTNLKGEAVLRIRGAAAERKWANGCDGN